MAKTTARNVFLKNSVTLFRSELIESGGWLKSLRITPELLRPLPLVAGTAAYKRFKRRASLGENDKTSLISGGFRESKCQPRDH